MTHTPRIKRALLLMMAVFFSSGVAKAGSGTGLTVVDLNASHVIRGTTYSQVIVSATGGTSPYSYALVSGSLPSGMAFASNGTLSGMTCGANGNYVINVRVTDNSAATATGNVRSALTQPQPEAARSRSVRAVFRTGM